MRRVQLALATLIAVAMLATGMVAGAAHATAAYATTGHASVVSTSAALSATANSLDELAPLYVAEVADVASFDGSIAAGAGTACARELHDFVVPPNLHTAPEPARPIPSYIVCRT